MSTFSVATPIQDIYTGFLTERTEFYTNSYTFICLLDGELTYIYEDKAYTLTGEDVVFAAPDTSFIMDTVDSAIFFKVTFDYIFTENILGLNAYKNITCTPALSDGSKNAALAQQLAAIATLWLSDSQSNRLYLESKIYSFFHYLKYYHIRLHKRERPEHLTQKQFHNICQMTAYIEENHAKPLALSDLAAHFHMTPQYTANFFKQALSRTFFDYLADIRLQEAYNYVVHSDESTFRIAAITGFPNPGSFTKAFAARYAMPPEQWRMKHPKKPAQILSGNVTPIESRELAKDYINNYIPLRSLATSSIQENKNVEHISINTSTLRACERPWSRLVNLGFARSFMHADYRHQLKDMQSALNFTYGRILRPFDIVKPMMVDNEALYDFSHLFQVLDFLKEIHILPHLELGNKIYKINFNSIDRVDMSDAPEIADYYEKLLGILPNFLRQCINRYGTEYMNRWQFELWTDHVFPQQSSESPKTYAGHFAAVYDIIKTYLPGCRVGAPGYNTYAPLSQFASVMQELSEQNRLPDFITAYIYPYVIKENNPTSEGWGLTASMISPDENIYYQRLKTLHDFCRKNYPQIKDIYITEYASDISSRNFINDSIYQATFMAKFNLDALDMGYAYAYWLISDIPLEYKDSNKILFGGNGLINRNGIYKPGFHAAHFLMDLGHLLISHGKNYVLTSSGFGHFQFMIFNYAHMHEDFCRDNTSYISLKNPTAVFHQPEPLNFVFSMEQMPPGNYRIRHYCINNDYGNLLNEWIRLGAMENLSRSDIDYLKKASWPYHELYYKEIQDKLELTCHLQPQQVDLYIFELIV